MSNKLFIFIYQKVVCVQYILNEIFLLILQNTEEKNNFETLLVKSIFSIFAWTPNLSPLRNDWKYMLEYLIMSLLTVPVGFCCSVCVCVCVIKLFPSLCLLSVSIALKNQKTVVKDTYLSDHQLQFYFKDWQLIIILQWVVINCT